MPKPAGTAGRGRRGGGAADRPVAISKALSRLLRHAAQQDHVPIDSHGYVRLDQALRWQRLWSMQPRVDAAEVVEAVRSSDKGRFGLKYIGKGKGKDSDSPSSTQEADGGTEAEIGQPETGSETQKALIVFDDGDDTDPTHFFIRATQGHSMPGVAAENLLTPLFPTNKSDNEVLTTTATTTTTIVHGTFYGAWETILQSGGLKGMGRNHVHFASGPPLEAVLAALSESQSESRSKSKSDGQGGRKLLARLMAESNVRSGMRPDAQILIYIDVHRVLEQQQHQHQHQQQQEKQQQKMENGHGGVRWWRSENGVILSQGDDGTSGLVGLDLWDTVVEVKEGLGVLWKREEGVVRELPAELKAKGMPRGKGVRGGGGEAKGGARTREDKPSLKVEKKDDSGQV